jgi:hypothetical protein
MKNPKAKGNNFERDISEKLSLWLTKGEEKRGCWRSDTSGAAATIWAKKNQEARYVLANSGDIKQIADKGLYPELDKFFQTFVVECKHYKEIDIYPPFNKVLTTWFDQLIREKEATGKWASLIFKANNRKVIFAQEPNSYHHPTANKLVTIYYRHLTLDLYLLDEVINTNNDNETCRRTDPEPQEQPPASRL